MGIIIEVLGKPVGKGRPRFSTAAGFVQTFTPKKTVDFENLVKLSYAQQCPDHVKLNGAIMAIIHAYFPIPKSVSKKKRASMENAPYTHKADCDNIAKAVLDSLNGIAYDDDSQVYSLSITKMYSDSPRTIIILQEIDETSCNCYGNMVHC